MLLQRLVPRLKAQFDGQFSLTENGAIFPAKHPVVGAVEVLDDGDELTICVGNFTHVHFNNYDNSLTIGQAGTRIVDDAVDFLVRLFSDQIVLWGSRSGRGGCYSRGERPSMLSIKRGQEYSWSGPISNQD